MIEIKDLWYRYPGSEERFILQGIDLCIREGESVSIMGANGSGKTTLARCLNGLLLPSRGQVVVDGFSTADSAGNLEAKRRVGLVFQNPEHQFVSTTVEREMAFGLENLGLAPALMHRRVTVLLREFGLERYRNRSPHNLSGGEKQLLALASVLVMEPKYLVLDEPTSLLDPPSRELILKHLMRLHHQSREFTPILITQFPEEALWTQRLIILHRGKILLDDVPSRVFENVRRLRSIGVDVPIAWSVKDLLQQGIFESVAVPAFS